MDLDQQHLDELSDALGDTESATLLVVADPAATVESVAAALGARLAQEQASGWDGAEEETAWSLVAVAGGVLAFEDTGYGDPSLAALSALSRGGTASVVRSNIDGSERFGYARGGEVLFDDDEYCFLEDTSEVPGEVRALVELACLDPEEDDDAEDAPSGFVVGLALVEQVTGLRLLPADLARTVSAPRHPAPSLVYARGS